MKVPTIKKSREFQLISKTGQKFFSKTVLLIRKSSPLQTIRVGYTVSKKVGNAVVRNQAKRRLREAVAAVAKQYPDSGFDCNLIAFKEISSASYQQILNDLEFLFKKFPKTKNHDNRTNLINS